MRRREIILTTELSIARNAANQPLSPADHAAIRAWLEHPSPAGWQNILWRTIRPASSPTDPALNILTACMIVNRRFHAATLRARRRHEPEPMPDRATLIDGIRYATH